MSAAPRVLVVDDNQVNQRVVVGMLATLGVAVTVAGNGRRAVELFRDLRPDLILMDCQMPELDGFEATRAIRRIEEEATLHHACPIPARRTRIIALTAMAMVGDRERCLVAGMDDYLSKPIDAVVLTRLVRSALGMTETAAVLPADPPRAVPQVIDDAAVERMRGYGAGALEDILGALAGEIPTHRELLIAALAAGDPLPLAKLAHVMKGSAGSVGAGELCAACAELERLARERRVDEARAHWSEVERALARAEARVAEILGGAPLQTDRSDA